MDETVDLIRKNAALAIKQFTPLTTFPFGLNRQSVEWVEGFIERQRVRGEEHDGLINVLGSFLGEAIIAEAGGAWAFVREEYAVEFIIGDRADSCFPFSKVAKQFENGVEGGDSILSFYDVSVNLVAQGMLGAPKN